MHGFSGILQVDGYAGYNRLIAPESIGSDIKLAYCWAHARRKLVEITRNSSAPIAEDGVKRIGELYRIEAELRGLDPEVRRAGRQERSAPLVADMQTWLGDFVRFDITCRPMTTENICNLVEPFLGLFPG